MAFDIISKESGTITATNDLPIHFDLYVPSGKPEAEFPVILFLHGFKGFKDWGPFPDACEEIARAGFGVVAFNFSLNGVGGEDMTDFDRLDEFARETLTQDLDDVGRVITALNDGEISTGKAGLSSDRIGILGHSRGGQTAVAAAAEYPEIAVLVTWSAVANYLDRWSSEMKNDWEQKGYTEIQNARTGQTMRINKEVYEDAHRNADRVIALNRVGELHIPALFIHAQDDEGVSPRNAEILYRNCASSDKELKLIPGTGHTFDGGHPFEEDEFPPKFQKVLDFTQKWFEYYLK